jgi:hypothetical protein
MSLRTRFRMTVLAALLGAVSPAAHAQSHSPHNATVVRAADSPDGLIWD